MPEGVSFQSVREMSARAWACWNQINAPRLGAALAFYTLWAVAPLLVLCLGIAGLVFGEEAARAQIGTQVQQLLGGAGAAGLKSLLENASRPSNNIAAAAGGFAMLILGASGVFAELHDSLNLVWGIPNPEGGGVIGIVKTRFLGFLMVLGVGVLLAISVGISSGISLAAHFFGNYLPAPGATLYAANVGATFLIVTLVFALLYKYVPQTPIEWRDVWVGAAVTSILFALGKFLTALYMAKIGVSSAYGAASSLVVFVIWVYYSAQIFFLGAEFTRAFAERHGSRAVAGGLRRPVSQPSPRRVA